MTLLQQLKCDDLKSELDRVRNFSRMWARNLGDRVCLSDDEKVFDFSQEILCLAFNGIPGR